MTIETKLQKCAILKVMLRRAAILLTVGLALFAQGDNKRPLDASSLEQRLAVVETKLDNLKTLDDRVSKLTDKIDGLNLQLAAINTKLEIIQWFGGAIGLLLLGSLWSTFSEKMKSRDRDSRDELIRSEVARVLREHDVTRSHAPSAPRKDLRAQADLAAAVEAGRQAYRESVARQEEGVPPALE